MKATTVIQRLLLTSITLFAVFLNGCTSPRVAITPIEEIPIETRQAELYLRNQQFSEAAMEFKKLAEQSSSPLSERYLIRSAEASLLAGDIISAISSADSIDTSQLSGQSNYQLTLLYSQIDVSMGKSEQALERLDSIPISNLDPGFRRKYHSIRANTYSVMGNLLESARERTYLDTLLDTPAEKEQNQAAILEALTLLSPQTLEMLQPPPPDILGGWMELARQIKLNSGNREMLETALDTWQEKFPNHPAQIKKIENQTLTRTALPQDLQKIAIILPQSGRYSKAANTILSGILSAYYQSETDPLPQLLIYDSDSSDIRALYQLAEEKGAQVIIGPLEKSRVLELMTSEATLQVPVLALNQPDTETRSPTNLYQFGLSPEDEVEQSAASAWLKGHRKALILAPSNSYGQRIASHFADYWKNLGGELLEAQGYPPQQTDFSNPIQQLLNLDSSNTRFKQLRSQLNRKIEFEPRRRQDADFIFLSASTRNARLIRPQLQFFRASRLPVYATSSIYSGEENPSLDIDLNSLYFTDIPWKKPPDTVQPNDEISLSGLTQNWQNISPALQRLFALGYDAYSLIPQLGRLKQSPEARFPGLSGDLYLDSENRLHRQLTLFQFRNGKPRPVDKAPLLQQSFSETLEEEITITNTTVPFAN